VSLAILIASASGLESGKRGDGPKSPPCDDHVGPSQSVSTVATKRPAYAARLPPVTTCLPFLTGVGDVRLDLLVPPSVDQAVRPPTRLDPSATFIAQSSLGEPLVYASQRRPVHGCVAHTSYRAFRISRRSPLDLSTACRLAYHSAVGLGARLDPAVEPWPALRFEITNTAIDLNSPLCAESLLQGSRPAAAPIERLLHERPVRGLVIPGLQVRHAFKRVKKGNRPEP